MPRRVMYHTDNPGRIIKAERERQGMSQEELADLIGVSREMVSRMEQCNHGLSSIVTRRAVAKALGISPLVLGVGSLDDIQVEPIYNTNLLRTMLAVHREAYFFIGNFGIPVISTVVSELESILKEKDNPKDILEIYAEYNTLGILVGKDEMNLVETAQFIENSLDAARSLNNPTLLARALSAASSAMYNFSNQAEAEKYALEAVKLRKIPNHLQALIQTDLARATGDMTAINLAKRLVSRPSDYPNLKLDTSYCMLCDGYVLFDTKQYEEALEELINAEEETPENFKRRHNSIQTLQAECYLSMKKYDDAEIIAETALKRAQATNSKFNIVRLQRVTRALKKRTQ